MRTPAIDNSFLRSRFARRMFLLFVLSALVPAALAAMLSYMQTAVQLREQSSRQLLITGKSLGLEVFRRLSAAERELVAVGQGMLRQQADGGAGWSASATGSAFTAVIAIPGKDSAVGSAGAFPMLTAVQRRQLEAGRSVLVLRERTDGTSDIMLVRAQVPGASGSGLLAGVLDYDRLWSLEDLYTEPDGLLVLSDDGSLVHGTPDSYRHYRSVNGEGPSNGASGYQTWEWEGARYLAGYWTLFTPSGFSGPELVFVLSRPEAAVLAPISSFRALNGAVLLLSMLVISLVAARTIRRRLQPLATLHTATRRIARGDFGGRVEIDSDDEFTVLGDAFNAMTTRLADQFTSISTMVEIDRLILSSFDARFITATVLGRVRDLTPCTAAALLVLDEEVDGRGAVAFTAAAPEAAIAEADVTLSQRELGLLADNPDCLLLQHGGHDLAFVGSLAWPDVARILVFPLFIQQQLAGAFLFGYRALPEEPEACAGLRKFVDHVAVALSNAGWEERLYHQAHYDTLTNLPNRALLKDRLQQALARAQRSRGIVGVLFLDLDNFKLVNDSLGHAVGDAYLKSVAAVLQGSVREVDTVVRFGGDEFLVIVPDIDGVVDPVSELGLIAAKIQQAVQREFTIDGHTLHTKVSIGIAAYPKDGAEVDELIRNADAAMYLAKNNGRSRYEFFAPELNAVASRRLQVEQELRAALARGEFVVRYQPKVAGGSRELAGAEALISWNHPQHGMVGPSEFIGLAEETGLIVDIGAWVIRSVCTQLAAWRDAGLEPKPVAINVSARQFGSPDFTAKLFAALADSSITPDLIELEITESMVMSDTDDSIARLADLRSRGVRLSLDDFGTGYSSLSYLRKMPIHTLKIDKSFVDEIVTDQDSYAIVAATVYLAHTLGLEVVAEGVESPEQFRLLQGMNCDVIQGYYISPALDAELFATRFLGQGRDLRLGGRMP
ncbi:MAG: EAL domain-containing protein [Pseudomonadota bacterium]